MNFPKLMRSRLDEARNLPSPVFKNGYRAICRICIEKRFDEIDKLEVKPIKYNFVLDSDEEV